MPGPEIPGTSSAVSLSGTGRYYNPARSCPAQQGPAARSMLLHRAPAERPLHAVSGSSFPEKIVLVPEPEDVAQHLLLKEGSSVFILNDIYSVPERDLMISGIKTRMGGTV